MANTLRIVSTGESDYLEVNGKKIVDLRYFSVYRSHAFGAQKRVNIEFYVDSIEITHNTAETEDTEDTEDTVDTDDTDDIDDTVDTDDDSADNVFMQTFCDFFCAIGNYIRTLFRKQNW